MSIYDASTPWLARQTANNALPKTCAEGSSRLNHVRIPNFLLTLTALLHALALSLALHSKFPGLFPDDKGQSGDCKMQSTSDCELLSSLEEDDDRLDHSFLVVAEEESLFAFGGCVISFR